jgi:hypothetical protein
MTTTSIAENPQASFFEMLGFSNQMIDEAINAEPKKRKRRKSINKIVHQQLSLMLDVLDTPENILAVPEEWTDDDISNIREYMLKRHIEFVLDGRCGKETVQEAWDWIMSEETHPFSFSACVQDMAIEMGFSIGNYIAIDRDMVRVWIYSLAVRENLAPNFTLLD